MSSTDTERSEAGRGRAAASFGYHPALDGVRAIAIAMVLMVHASITSPWTWTTGWSSWLGVDVFFVLSGFLITTLLLQEIDRRGKVDLLAFYIRRFLRLYPMILVVVVVSLATMVLLPVADQSRTTGLGTTSIAFYFNNWLVIAQGGSGSLGVFGHLWSLAIEEQFYLVWPIVVIVCLKLGSRRLLPFLVAALGAAGSALHRWTSWNQAKAWRVGDATIVERTDHLRAASRYWYHSSFTRVDGLLIGCALAVVVVSLRGPTASRLQAWLHDATGWPVARLHRIIRRTVGALGLLGVVVAELIVYRSHGEVFPEPPHRSRTAAVRDRGRAGHREPGHQPRRRHGERLGVAAPRLDRAAVVRDLRAPPDLHHRRVTGSSPTPRSSGRSPSGSRSSWPGSPTATTRRRSFV